MVTFRRLLETARAEGADALLLPGDLFEQSSTRPETVATLARELGTLPLPAFIAPGNHDPLENRGFWSVPFPENVIIFGPEWERHSLGPLVVWGRGYTFAAGRENPLASFPGESQPFILVLHADVGARGHESPYFPITAEDVDRTGALWAAVGHIHKPGPIGHRGAYAGSLEPLGFDEEGRHGALLVDLDPASGRATTRPLPLAAREYATWEMDASGLDRSQAREALLTRVKGLDPDRMVVRVRLTGRRRGTEAPVEAWGRQAEEAGWTIQVEDRMLPESPAEADPLTVRGRFVAALEARFQSASPEELPLLRRALLDGLAALDGRKILDL